MFGKYACGTGVNRDTISALAGSMTSVLRYIKPAVSLEEQARIAGCRPRKAMPRSFGPGQVRQRGFVLVKRVK